MRKLPVAAAVVCMVLGLFIHAHAQHGCTSTVEGNASDFTFTIPCAVVGSSADGVHDSIWIQFKLNNVPPYELVDFSGPVQNDPGANAAAPVAKTGSTYSTTPPLIVPTQAKAARAPFVEDPDPLITPVANHFSGDGDLRKGATWPEPRFTDNGNGTVTDNLSGLIWLKNADCQEFYSEDDTGQNNRPWTDALAAANNLAAGYCGLQDSSVAGDWRLPNLYELGSLRHFDVHSPPLPNTAGTGQWVEGDPFTGIQINYYWSSTTVASFEDYAWYMNFVHGRENSHTKVHEFYVWPVRGGQ